MSEEEIKSGRFLHVLACNSCAWFKIPPRYVMYGYLDNVYSCCPQCGSEDIKETVGQYLYIEIIEKHIFSPNTVRNEIAGFKRREA